MDIVVKASSAPRPVDSPVYSFLGYVQQVPRANYGQRQKKPIEAERKDNLHRYQIDGTLAFTGRYPWNSLDEPQRAMLIQQLSPIDGQIGDIRQGEKSLPA